MTGQLLSMALALSMLASQKSATDCFNYFPMGESFGYSSDEGGGGTSYLGVDTRNLTQDRLADLHLKDDNGVEVTMVDQDAPAGKAGIKEHDVILSVNGSAVQSVEQLRRMIREIPAGRAVTLGLMRGGQPLTLKAQLADRKTTFATMPMPEVRVKPFKFEMPNMSVLQDMDIPVSVVVVHSSARSGLMVENLTPQLGMFFGAKDGHGVLVRSVEKGSAAEKAGFHAGDVIVRVNDEPISDTGDFTHTLRMGKQNTVSVNIIRDKKEQILSLTLPERKQSGVQQESFEVPEIDVETQVELDAARTEVAKIQPEMMRYAEEIRRMQPEIEKAAEDRMKMQEEMEKVQEELREQQRDYQEIMIHNGGGADI